MNLPRLLSSLGIFFLLLAAIFQIKITTPNKLAFAGYNGPQKSVTLGSKKPIGLTIASISLSLPIKEANIVGDNWEQSDQAVSYLTSSPFPGEKGNSILYGHNWPNLLGNLPKVRVGDTIILHFEDRTQKEFKVELTQVVSPTQVSVLTNTQDPRITLYTCAGIFDQNRFVVVAS